MNKYTHIFRKVLLSGIIIFGGTYLAFYLVESGFWFLDPSQGNPAKIALCLVFVVTPLDYIWKFSDSNAPHSSDTHDD